MIKVRDAKFEDARILCAAEQAIAQTPGYLASRPSDLSVDSFQKKIASLTAISNGKYVVAESDGLIVGHALLDPMGLESIKHIVRLTIAVHQGHEEQGIGEVLLSHLIDWARQAPQVEKIELNVREVNLRAIRLYQKMGFNTEGRLRLRVRIPDGSFMDDLEMGLFVKSTPSSLTVVSLAIGKVISDRNQPEDDNWDRIQSYVQLDERQFSDDAFLGLEAFSHVEIIFFMNQVDVRKIETSCRHPRNNPDWPKVGIFAQRGKNRPNQIGTTVCKIKKIDGLKLHIEGLDAIDGTPILDIKPWVSEFGPREKIHQPKWITELMKSYWRDR